MNVNIVFPYRQNNDWRREKNLEFITNHYKKLNPSYIINEDDDDNLFNRGRALNRGFSCIDRNTDVVIFADGDLYVPIEALE